MPTALAEWIFPVWARWGLVRRLVLRDLVRRYRGSRLGIAWAFVRPLTLLMAFCFLSRLVLRVSWGTAETGAANGLRVLVGVLVLQFFVDTWNRAPGLLLENPDLTKKVAFPLEILAISAVLSSSVPLFCGLALVTIGKMLLVGGSPLAALALPLLLIPAGTAALGGSLLLAATGPYLRDLRHVVGLASTALMFVSPVFYPLSSLPVPMATLALLNPVASTIRITRVVLLDGGVPRPVEALAAWAVAGLFLGLGMTWFRAVRGGFSDAL